MADWLVFLVVLAHVIWYVGFALLWANRVPFNLAIGWPWYMVRGIAAHRKEKR